MIVVKLPKGIENRLALLAAKTRQTKDHYARKETLNQLEEMENTNLSSGLLKPNEKKWPQQEFLDGKTDIPTRLHYSLVGETYHERPGWDEWKSCRDVEVI